MKNVKLVRDGDILTITVDLNEDFGLSASGKSRIIASTEGNALVDDISVGLNVYKSTKK